MMRYDTNRINAVVLAGGINRIELYPGYRPGYKALLPVNGKPLIGYTLDALNKSPETDRICIVGPEREIRAAIEKNAVYEYEKCEDSLIANVRRGLTHFRQAEVVLVITADVPLVTAASISLFLTACAYLESPYDDSIFWSMVPEQKFSGSYEQVKKGFNRFRDISVCHGNLFLITPSLAQNARFCSRLEHIYEGRKSTIRAALAVGPRAGIGYILGVHLFRLFSISGYAALASSGFGVGIIPVVMDQPGIAVDIDEERDYLFIREEINRKINERDTWSDRAA